MAVPGRESIAVIDLDHLAVTAAPARRRYRAIGGDLDRIADFGAEVEAGMHCGSAEKRVDAGPETRHDVGFADDRLAHREADQRAGQLLDFGARDLDRIELPIECGRVERR